MKNIKKIFITLITLVLFVYSSISFIIYTEFTNQYLAVHFLDIGQGDGILIRTPDKRTIIVDGGPDNSLVYKLGEFLPFYERDIDLLILTHPDADHLISFVELLKRYRVHHALITGIADDRPTYQAFLELLAAQRTAVLIAGSVTRIPVGSEVMIEILYPFASLFNQVPEDSNDSSIIFSLHYGEHRFLFTGDASVAVEHALLQAGVVVHADVLKVGHHGSDTSTSQEFLEAVAPSIAVIQVGKDNKFGHPHRRVLDRLDAHSVATFINSLTGDITIQSDGHILRVIP